MQGLSLCPLDSFSTISLRFASIVPQTRTQEMSKEIETGETRETWRTDSSRSVDVQDVPATPVVEPEKRWWHPIKEPGSAAQIVISAVVAIAIGLAVTSTVDSVPEACTEILAIPGTTWLRALRATGKSNFT